jgi:predicted ATP-dependent endonuclease of OLD family
VGGTSLPLTTGDLVRLASPVQISQVDISHYRGWEGPVSWQPGTHAALVGPNSGGKTTLLRAVDLVLNPYRDAYRDRLESFDYFGLDTATPVEITVVLHDLTTEDQAYFEPYLEGRRDDGTFGGWDSPGAEFDEAELVLRMRLRASYGEPARASYARPEASDAQVRQADKIRIGWQYVPATLDPLHELAFYGNSLLSKLFERGDVSVALDEIRAAIETAKAPLLQQPDVAAAMTRLTEAAARLQLVEGADALDFAVAGLSDRRVLQSLQLVVRGRRSATRLPLPSHGRGLLRILLLTAFLENARTAGSNLILGVEEPEQNLEPVNQRLVMRSLLLPADTGAAQVIVSTHSTDVAAVVPLEEIHLVRDVGGTPAIRALRDTAPAEQKFFERHARGSLVDGLYADLVVLVEGPTERAALPVLWQKARPGSALDENRIEVIDCESVNRMPSYARFFRELQIPVVAVCDADTPSDYAKLVAAAPAAIVRWSTHTDWEGVVCAEADTDAIASALEECRGTLGDWGEHHDMLRARLLQEVGDVPELASASDIPSLVAGYDQNARRVALADLMRGRSGVDFKSAIYARIVAEQLPDVPPTIHRMIVIVHGVAAGDQEALANHDL